LDAAQRTSDLADTRIILYALNMNNQFKDKNVMGRILIKSPDTDVLVLLVHYFSRMSNTRELWFQTGTIIALKVTYEDENTKYGTRTVNVFFWKFTTFSPRHSK
jgi:hypothetical protein